jgi:asparagine N-glycosylation enzyme membrane subunit Stt3
MGQRLTTGLLLLGMGGLGFFHLLAREHYFVINYDSFWFHYLARRISQGYPVPDIGSGLAYPVAILGKVIGLDTAALVMGPLLGILTGAVIYWGVSRLYSARIALLAVVCFVFAQIPRFAFLSGNLDRDGLHMLIMTTGILGLGLYVKTRDNHYLALTFATIPLLYLEWGQFALAQYIPALVGIILLMDVAKWDSKWFWVGVGLLAIAIFALGRFVMWTSFFAGTDISELEPLGPQSLIQYATIAVPVAFGISRSHRFVLAWAVVFLLMGVFASRLSIYAAVPACIMGAFGLERLWSEKTAASWRYICLVGFSFLVVLAWVVPRNVTMPNDWHDALVWVKGHTAEDATVAVWWSHGYWVMDVANRETPVTQANGPLVDEIARVYFAPNEEYAHDIAEWNGWDYLIMSTRERHYLDAIRERAGTVGHWEPFYEQVLSGKVGAVYANETVVVLRS